MSFKVKQQFKKSSSLSYKTRLNLNILKIFRDIPDIDILPSNKVLFLCKLSPVTSEEDLYSIFSRYGKINFVKIVRDKISKISLNYGFIGYTNKKCCENAYFNSSNTIINECKVKLLFCQSIYKN